MQNNVGRNIILIGVSHLGMISYFKELQELLDRHEQGGWIITHEGSNWSDIYTAGNEYFSAEQLRQTRPHVERSLRALEPFGIGEQSEVIKPRKTWVFIDPLHTATARTLLGTITVGDVQAQSDAIAEKPRAYLEQVLKQIERHTNEEVPLTANLAERDKLAVEAILKLVETRHVVSCWGARHLMGMGTMLEEQGFSTNLVEWTPFFPTSLP